MPNQNHRQETKPQRRIIIITMRDVLIRHLTLNQQKVVRVNQHVAGKTKKVLFFWKFPIFFFLIKKFCCLLLNRRKKPSSSPLSNDNNEETLSTSKSEPTHGVDKQHYVGRQRVLFQVCLSEIWLFFFYFNFFNLFKYTFIFIFVLFRDIWRNKAPFVNLGKIVFSFSHRVVYVITKLKKIFNQ